MPREGGGGALFSGEPSKGLIGEAEVAQTRAEPSPMTCFSRRVPLANSLLLPLRPEREHHVFPETLPLSRPLLLRLLLTQSPPPWGHELRFCRGSDPAPSCAAMSSGAGPVPPRPSVSGVRRRLAQCPVQPRRPDKDSSRSPAALGWGSRDQFRPAGLGEDSVPAGPASLRLAPCFLFPCLGEHRSRSWAWGQPEPDESLIPESLVGGEPLPTYAGHSARMRKGLRGCRTPSEGAAACCRGAAPNRSPCLRSLAANARCKRNWETGSASNGEGRKRAGWGAWSWQRPLGTEMETPHLSHPGSGFSPRAPPWGRCQQQTRPQKRVGSRRRGEPTDPWSVRPGKRELPGDPGQEQLATEAGRVPRGHVAIDCRCISAVARASSETVCLADSQAAAFLSITAGC